MNLLKTAHVLLTYLIGTFGLVLLVYWLIIISYRLYLIRNKHKQYLKASELDPRIHSQILHSFITVRNRDICLVLLILLEILIIATFSFGFPEFWSNLLHSNTTIVKHTFPNCTNLNRVIISVYIHPACGLFLIVFINSILTQLMLLSFLNSYLAGRYFGHSFPKIVVWKYIFSSIFQTFILTLCIIRKLQIFFFPICTLLIFLNWLNLIASSRKVCRAIRSKMKEIRLFEWNPALFRNHSRNLKQYRISMAFLIGSFLSLLIATTVLTISYFLIVGSCFIDNVYKVHLSITIPEQIKSRTYDIINLFVFFLGLVYGILLLFPSCYLFLVHTATLLYDCCTGKGNLHRIKNTLFDPLLNH